MRTLRKQADEGKKKPNMRRESKTEKRLGTRRRFLRRSAAWEVGKQSPDVLSIDMDINNLLAEVT